MVALVVCIAMVLAAVLVRALGLPRLNAVSAFTASWVPMLFVAGVLGGASQGISDLTWLMILTGWASLVIGAIVGWLPSKRVASSAPAIEIDIQRLRRIHAVLTGAFMVYVAFQITKAMPLIAASGGWQAIFSTGGGAYRIALLEQSLAQSQTDLESGSLALAIFNYATFMAGTIATYTGVILWRAGYRLTGVLPVAVAAFLSLVTLQRTSVVLVSLLFVFGLAALRLSGTDVPRRIVVWSAKKPAQATGKRRSAQRMKTLVAGSLVAAGIAGFLYTTTNIRDGQATIAIDRQVSEYVVGGVAGLDAQNIQGSDWAALPGERPGMRDPHPGMGGYTFSGLMAVLYRLGAPIQLTRVNLNFTPVELYGRPTLTNVVTAFGEFYLDFRWPGLVVLPFILGWATSSSQRRLAASKRISRVPIVTYLLTICFWSYFVAWLSDLRQILVAVVGGAVLTWTVQRRAYEPPAKMRDAGPTRVVAAGRGT